MTVTDTMRFPGLGASERASLSPLPVRRKTGRLPPTCDASYISTFRAVRLLVKDGALETRDSPLLSAGHRAVRMRQQLRDALDGARDSRRSLRQVPPVLHRPAEAD